MNDKPKRPLRRHLQDCDPTAGEPPLTARERTQIRARLLQGATAARQAGAPGGLRTAWAVGALLVAVLAGVTWLGWPAATSTTDIRAPRAMELSPRHSVGLTAPPTLEPRVSLGTRPARELPAGRSIHFTAPRGTRLVWVVPSRQRDAG